MDQLLTIYLNTFLFFGVMMFVFGMLTEVQTHGRLTLISILATVIFGFLYGVAWFVMVPLTIHKVATNILRLRRDQPTRR